MRGFLAAQEPHNPLLGLQGDQFCLVHLWNQVSIEGTNPLGRTVSEANLVLMGPRYTQQTPRSFPHLSFYKIYTLACRITSMVEFDKQLDKPSNITKIQTMARLLQKLGMTAPIIGTLPKDNPYQSLKKNLIIYTTMFSLVHSLLLQQ